MFLSLASSLNFNPMHHAPHLRRSCALALALFYSLAASTSAQGDDALPGEGPALGQRIDQADVAAGRYSLRELRREGRRIFSTPFNKLDGFGDGPMNVLDPTSPGGRPTMADNGTFLRVNGLDSQACIECHAILSARTIPATFAIGGVGGIAAVALPGPTELDIDDEGNNGFAFFNGRMINPPFIWGSGGVELVAKEMTSELQALMDTARTRPGVPVDLVTKGISFGQLSFDVDTGEFDTSLVVGVDADLVVRPFGRKGDNSTVRAFGINALQFHHGMQPAEAVGFDVDADGDGVVNEILPGELSALSVFSVLSQRPETVRMDDRQRQARGTDLFTSIGCATCHVPELRTRSESLGLAFPEIEADPGANVFLRVDLRGKPAGFRRHPDGGLRVSMFSDLKRHDMGPDLAESTGHRLDRHFITPRLWGIADTAPYLHDGRALTLREAIEAHGGEGTDAAGSFRQLAPAQQSDVLYFLNSLRVPERPNRHL